MKILRMTEVTKQKMLENVKAQLDKTLIVPDKLTVDLTNTTKAEKQPKIIFKEKAANKMWQLIDACEKEIAWHGCVTKEGDTYTIEDILVFPQEVTGSTATAIEDEYVAWMQDLDDDTFNHMRFHGHSHVNMGVTPSGVDTQYQEDLVNTVKDFYIFGIFNKKRVYNLYLYSIEDNTLYETNDLDIELFDTTLAWAEDQIEKYVKKTKPIQASPSYTNRRRKKHTNSNKDNHKQRTVYDDYLQELHPELYGCDYGYGYNDYEY